MKLKHILGLSGETGCSTFLQDSLLRSFFEGSLCIICTTLEIEIH